MKMPDKERLFKKVQELRQSLSEEEIARDLDLKKCPECERFLVYHTSNSYESPFSDYYDMDTDEEYCISPDCDYYRSDYGYSNR